ncbi:hypothetical protein Barb4_04967 [Bacteroidales bacterium Barb4]|jgi:hypothetical protein|nr:hypothetical protein Barb4_04967 [Bacteroidales bacterium Barb4]
MPKEPLDFTYTVEVDEDKVADGIALAKEMMGDALKNLALYADGCPACLLSMFGAVADLTVEEAKAGWDKDGISSFAWLFAEVTGDERRARLDRHRRRMSQDKVALLREAQKRGAKVHIHAAS